MDPGTMACASPSRQAYARLVELDRKLDAGSGLLTPRELAEYKALALGFMASYSRTHGGAARPDAAARPSMQRAFASATG